MSKFDQKIQAIVALAAQEFPNKSVTHQVIGTPATGFELRLIFAAGRHVDPPPNADGGVMTVAPSAAGNWTFTNTNDSGRGDRWIYIGVLGPASTGQTPQVVQPTLAGSNGVQTLVFPAQGLIGGNLPVALQGLVQPVALQNVFQVVYACLLHAGETLTFAMPLPGSVVVWAA